MSHNISTFRDVAHNEQAFTEEVLNNPVLSVEDSSGNRARILFKRCAMEPLGRPAVVLNPWPTNGARNGFDSGPVVSIEGEDLYALRALLLELPDEAFVEPAPAVEVAEQVWTPGDVCLFAADDYWATYTRLHDGTWQRISGTLGVDRATDYTDTVIEKKLADQTDRFSVLRKQVTA